MFKKLQPHTFKISYTGAVMVIVIYLDAIERGLNLRSGHTKGYEIGINCFSDKHTEGLTQNQHNCPSRATCLHVYCCFNKIALRLGKHN
jgi:hypothetical protein